MAARWSVTTRKLGGSYSITMPDGTRAMVSASDIVSIDGKSLAEAGSTGVAAGATGTEGASSSSSPPAASSGSAGFKVVKGKADKSEAPVVALQLWDDFIKNNAASPDLAAAKAEREAWDKLYKDNAERIKGKWVGGDELKELKKKADDLYREAVDPGESMGVRGVEGLRKLDQIIAMYPRHFGANYEKGYYNLVLGARRAQGSNEKLALAIKSLETTSQLAPTVPEVWSNLAIGYNFKASTRSRSSARTAPCKMRGTTRNWSRRWRRR
jgi:hypothetical protein